MKLTKKIIDSLKFEGKASKSVDYRWDSNLKGFGVRVYPSGSKKYVVNYRRHGRQRFMILGSCNVLTLDQARRRARGIFVEVLEDNDPASERKKARKGESVADLCSLYLVEYAKIYKKTWKKDKSRINRHVLPKWKLLKVRAIKRENVARLFHSIGEDSGIYEANRTLEMLSKMFDLAINEFGFLDSGAVNPAKKIKKYREKKRDRYITFEEFPRVAKAIDREESLFARNAIWLYMLSGLRKSELLEAKWENVDFDRKELRIPETKAGRVHHVPLSEPAINILRNLPREIDNPYILPGHVKGKHLVNIDKPWYRIRKAAGVEDVRLHDLRRSVGSWMAQSGASLHLIGKVLNHSNTSTTAIYARFGEDHVRSALESHGKQIMSAAGKVPMAEIVPLKKAK